MLIVDEEATTFEANPLGNRQRLKPRDSFIARNAACRPPVIEEPSSIAVDDSMMMAMHETVDESLGEGMYTMSDVVLPPSAVVHAALDDVPAMPSLVPQLDRWEPAPALMLLPKEIDYRAVAPDYPPTESTHALPVASRRVRYLAVPAIAALALVVLGGAMMPPDLEAVSPTISVTATQEPTSTVRVHERANEPPAPPEPVEEAPAARPARIAKVARSISRRPAAPKRVVVNASSALGNLRPGRAF